MKKQAQDIARNRKALHDYEVLETYEAGIALTGTEVRSLRDNHCQLTDCFALIRHGEVWLHGVHIPPYAFGNIANPDPDCTKTRSANLSSRPRRRAWRLSR